jgi:hypothetical protein
MEPRGCNQLQISRTSKPERQANYVATSCHQLLAKFHGKGGRRFESFRGLSKDLHIAHFRFNEPARGRGAEPARAAGDDRGSVGEVYENCFMPQ